MSNKEKQTHFGFEQVSFEEKTQKVADVFHSVADQYDIMNDLMSMGTHRLWKRFAIKCMQARRGQRILDLAAGSGDLAALLSPIVGETGEIVLSDINASMLTRGRDRFLDKGLSKNVNFVQADAEDLPFPDNYFDRLIIGFGLRNVTRKEKALNFMLRVLRPGGRAIILEFSQPVVPGLKPIYDLYSFKMLPWLGEFIAKDAESYRYLAESIRMHPDQETLKKMMQTAGFEQCNYHNLSGGIVAVHTGVKY